MAETEVAVQCRNDDCTEYGIPKWGPASMVADGVICGACWHPCEPAAEVEVDPEPAAEVPA